MEARRRRPRPMDHLIALARRTNPKTPSKRPIKPNGGRSVAPGKIYIWFWILFFKESLL
jgi:hypothetical protein